MWNKLHYGPELFLMSSEQRHGFLTTSPEHPLQSSHTHPIDHITCQAERNSFWRGQSLSPVQMQHLQTKKKVGL